jgi:hypothetical protein
MKMTRSRRSRSTRSQKRKRSKSQKGGNIPDDAVVIVRDPEDPQAPPVAMSYSTAKNEIFHEDNDISPSIRPRRHLTKEQIAAMQAGRAAARARRISELQV